ncbi:MAG: hypothetical protein LBC56_00560 [Oscillospiraceae bacterium]|jgi:hypothetical protein|nr:hypothetical protein [Oscillospiraceae bacterium]
MAKRFALWDAANAQPFTWYKQPLPGCVCSDGTPYCAYLKKGTVNKLMVHFSAGGSSWNEHTAQRPITPWTFFLRQEGYYFRGISSTTESMHTGIMQDNDARNPLNDWYALCVPYVSADLHFGNNDFPYKDKKGKPRILYHHGVANTNACLGLLKDFFPGEPEALFIGGESAGAFGSVANCAKVAALYPNCRNITVYSDAAHLHTHKFHSIIRDIWKVPPDLSAYAKSDYPTVDLFQYARDKTPPHTKFLHANSLYDQILIEYMFQMDKDRLGTYSHTLQEFGNTLKIAVKTLKKDIPNYSYYLTDYGKNKKTGTTPHTFSLLPKLFYADMQDGISVANWIKQAIEGKAIDVGEKLLNLSED